jgi:hypothetical protein
MRSLLFKHTGIAAILLSVAGACGYDNYEAPSSTLTGQIVYQENPIGVRNNTVELELWQHGYDDFEKIPVFVAQDGSFSAVLFNGDYKLVLRNGNGPWLTDTDSIDVSVRGNTIVNFPVEPFYTIATEGFAKNGAVIESTVSIEAINNTNAIEHVSLFIGTTNILDETNNAQRLNIGGGAIDISNPVFLSAPLNASLAGRSYVFARAGIKIAGVVEMTYTPVQKITF